MSEVTIYHAYNSSFGSLPAYGSGTDFLISKILVKAAKIFVVAGMVLLVVSFAPSLWYWAKAGGKDRVSALLYQTANKQLTVNNPLRGNSQQLIADTYQPRYDASLPVISTLKIPSIGVNTEINEATRQNLEGALKKGVWRANDAGTPLSRTEPTILAAHRFGYIAWSNTFRRENSFYNLPNLKVGETVEITYRQRKYVYEIYGESKGEEITDYSADLILYTCEQLNSNVRIFKYARLLEV